MLRFKPEVRIGWFNDELYGILAFASVWSVVRAVDVQVNSLNDPAPGRVPNSLHAYDLAADLEPVGNGELDRLSLARFLQVHLPAGYDVVYETSHVHVEFDVHRGPLMTRNG